MSQLQTGTQHPYHFRADEMVMVLLLTKLLQPSSAAEHPKPVA